MVTRHLMSVEEYLSLPEEKPYLEYVNGEVCPKPMPDSDHSDLVAALIAALASYRQQHGGHPGTEARTGFENPDDVRILLPDVSFYAAGRKRKGRVMPAPTLAVEVRSPDQSLSSLREKCRFYRRHGTDACWLVDPASRTVEVFEGERDGETLGAGATLTAAALPGFELPLRDLFAVLDEEE